MLLFTQQFVVVTPKESRNVPTLDLWAVHSGWQSLQVPLNWFSSHGTDKLWHFFSPLVLERRYPKEVQDLYETMRRFARILGPVEHDKFIESHARKYFEDFSINVLQWAYWGLASSTSCPKYIPLLEGRRLFFLLLPHVTASEKQMHLWFDALNEQQVGFFSTQLCLSSLFDFSVDRIFWSWVRSSVFLSRDHYSFTGTLYRWRNKLPKIYVCIERSELAVNCEFFKRRMLNYSMCT